MNSDTIASRWERFVELVGINDGAPWLRPPVAEPELDATEADLGFELPPDLRELLSIHNGGRLFDSHEWIGCAEAPDRGLAGMRQQMSVGFDQLVSAGVVDLRPGPRTLQVAWAAHIGILYDVDDQPGRLLYFDVESKAIAIPLCRDLVTLMDCYIAFAEAGMYRIDPLGLRLEGTSEAIWDIYLRNRVAGAAPHGIGPWLAWPGSAGFHI